ncbi:hypothetical protein DESPIG_00336 [Desulfovibrio piger ATCC 29098]|uniref:Uncharacterized protein n=1 Tax=Desulfovibrio piger ATCC 29098 TaxID=411464 RepID=B6WQL2_9BACT|nr:hypothetical protein DESPIG_00336 [Desulfovibrio piger ATCC 29098]
MRPSQNMTDTKRPAPCCGPPVFLCLLAGHAVFSCCTGHPVTSSPSSLIKHAGEGEGA